MGCLVHSQSTVPKSPVPVRKLHLLNCDHSTDTLRSRNSKDYWEFLPEPFILFTKSIRPVSRRGVFARCCADSTPISNAKQSLNSLRTPSHVSPCADIPTWQGSAPARHTTNTICRPSVRQPHSANRLGLQFNVHGDTFGF